MACRTCCTARACDDPRLEDGVDHTPGPTEDKIELNLDVEAIRLDGRARTGAIDYYR